MKFKEGDKVKLTSRGKSVFSCMGVKGDGVFVVTNIFAALPTTYIVRQAFPGLLEKAWYVYPDEIEFLMSSSNRKLLI